MSELLLSATEIEMAQLIIDTVNLEEVSVNEIDPNAVLFGDGLGLDSIDALEISLAISKRYGFQLRADNEHNQAIFGSLRSLTQYVHQHQSS